MSATEHTRLISLDALVRTARTTLRLARQPACDDAASATGFNRHLQAIWNSQQQVRNALRNTFNDKNPLLCLPSNVLHLVVHDLDQSEVNLDPRSLRTTCRQFMTMLDRACYCIQWETSPYSFALFQESRLSPLSCNALNWVFDPAMADSDPSSNWKTRLRQTRVLNMRILDEIVSPDHVGNRLDLQQRWQQLVIAWFEPAPTLERLSLVCDEYPLSGMEWTVPSDIFGGVAPRRWRLTAIQFKLTPTPAAFHNVTTLDYQPAIRRLSRTDLQDLFISLPRLRALKLRIYGVLPFDRSPRVEGAFEAPVQHSLRLLQIYIRRSIPAFVHYLIGASSAASLKIFQCALRASSWWEALADEVQHHTELAFGFEITEVVLRRPSPNPPLRMQLHHSRGPGTYSMGDSSVPRLDASLYAHHPLVTTISISQFLWPQGAVVVPLPALTSLTIFIGRCAQYSSATRFASFDDLLLWDTNSAVLDVPLLREVGLLYAASYERQACCVKPRHACCLRGRMIVSAEVICRVLQMAVVNQSRPLDVIRTSGVEFYETESQWRRQLLEVTCKVEDVGPPIDVHAALPSMQALSRFEELANEHCKDGI